MRTIYKRRSIRKFQDRSVEREKILKVLEAGMNAPSAMNQQPWQFVVIDDQNIIEKVLEVHPFARPAKEAPVSILVCGDLEKELAEGYWPIDCAAAVQNMLLEVTDIGLGGCWLGIYPKPERVACLKEALSVPETIVPFALIAVGYPAEDKEEKKLFDSSRIKYNSWDVLYQL